MQARLRDLQENHKGLWQKIKDFFKGWLDRVRKMLQQDTGFTKKELQAWDKLSDEIQSKLATMWGEGTADMARNLDLTEGVKLSEVQTTENAATEGGETTQFSEREIIGADGTNYGMGVYMDSTLLEGLTAEERVEMFQLYLDEIGGQYFDAVGKNGTAVKVKIADKGQRYTNERGRTVFANEDLRRKYRRNLTKQEAIVLVDEVLKTARFRNESQARHKHDWLDNNGSNPWQAWRTYMQDPSGKVYETILHITTATDGTLYLYDITPIEIEEAEQSGNSDTDLNLSGEQSGNSDTDLSTTKIAQSDDVVNPKNNDLLSEREADMPSDVDLVMGMDEKDATTPEGKALIREVQAKQKQIETLREKLAEAKRQLTTTKRALNTKGIGNVAGNVIRDFGISDAGGKNIRQQATAILTDVYQKALDQIDSGAAAAA